jgi:hypothetical protein
VGSWKLSSVADIVEVRTRASRADAEDVGLVSHGGPNMRLPPMKRATSHKEIIKVRRAPLNMSISKLGVFKCHLGRFDVIRVIW